MTKYLYLQKLYFSENMSKNSSNSEMNFTKKISAADQNGKGQTEIKEYTEASLQKKLLLDECSNLIYLSTKLSSPLFLFTNPSPFLESFDILQQSFSSDRVFFISEEAKLSTKIS